MKIVCGLGNPGRRYAGTRHNVGFMAVETFARPMEPSWTERWSARVARVSFCGQDLLLVEPQTFMNLSGEAVGRIVRFHRVPVSNLLVVHDDADLPLGRVLVRAGGGDGGHKGVRSVMDGVGSADFARIRVGIGRPADAAGEGLTDYVLSGCSEDERESLDAALKKAAVGIQEWAVGGVPRAQNRVNRRDRPVRRTPGAQPTPRGNDPSCPERADPPGPQDRKEDA